jgi:hypothetical protein
MASSADMQLGSLPPPKRGQRRNHAPPHAERGFYCKTYLPAGYKRMEYAAPPPVFDAKTGYEYRDKVLQDLSNYAPPEANSFVGLTSSFSQGSIAATINTQSASNILNKGLNCDEPSPTRPIDANFESPERKLKSN